MRKIALGFLALLCLFVFSLPVRAETYKKSETVILEKNQTIQGNYFAAGELVQIDGTVNGDVYAAGGKVIVNGKVNGDVLVAGGSITINGTVAQDVRMMGGELNIAGPVGGSVTAGGGSISILSPIGKSLIIGGGNVTLNNKVGTDVLVGTGQLTLGKEANIQGNLTYSSEQKATLQEGAIVSGKTSYHMVESTKKDSKDVEKFLGGANVVYKVFSFLSAFLIGYFFLKLTPLFFKQSASLIGEKPWAALGTGFAFLFLAPIIIVLLFLTVIGIPLAIAGIFGYVIYIYLAKIFVWYFVGEKIIRYSDKKNVSVLALFVGLLVYHALTLIPAFGWLISLLTIFFGIGALFLQKKISYRALRSKNQI